MTIFDIHEVLTKYYAQHDHSTNYYGTGLQSKCQKVVAQFHKITKSVDTSFCLGTKKQQLERLLGLNLRLGVDLIWVRMISLNLPFESLSLHNFFIFHSHKNETYVKRNNVFLLPMLLYDLDLLASYHKLQKCDFPPFSKLNIQIG